MQSAGEELVVRPGADPVVKSVGDPGVDTVFDPLVVDRLVAGVDQSVVD